MSVYEMQGLLLRLGRTVNAATRNGSLWTPAATNNVPSAEEATSVTLEEIKEKTP
jgi:hypothetical protein